MQTEATTPNSVGPRMLGVVASVLAMVWKRTKKLSTMSGPAVHRGKDRIQPIRLWRPSVMRVGGPSNVGRDVQTVPSKDKRNVGSCWLESLTGFNFALQFPTWTTRNNMQQRVQTDATANIQQCWKLLAINSASACMGLNVDHLGRVVQSRVKIT